MNNVDVIKDKNDIEKIKNILIIGDYRNYLMFIIGINTGLRITQILSLKFSDLIDNEDNVISKIDFNNKAVIKFVSKFEIMMHFLCNSYILYHKNSEKSRNFRRVNSTKTAYSIVDDSLLLICFFEVF